MKWSCACDRLAPHHENVVGKLVAIDDERQGSDRSWVDRLIRFEKTACATAVHQTNGQFPDNDGQPFVRAVRWVASTIRQAQVVKSTIERPQPQEMPHRVVQDDRSRFGDLSSHDPIRLVAWHLEHHPLIDCRRVAADHAHILTPHALDFRIRQYANYTLSRGTDDKSQMVSATRHATSLRRNQPISDMETCW